MNPEVVLTKSGEMNVNYELSNHLGNVNVVLSDRKYAVDDDNNGEVDYYSPDILMTMDYYPFGQEIASRSAVGTSYKYGYNGMEKDDEVSGEGNSYTTEFRQYDPRLGRWKSLDPLMMQFPWMSPYVAFDNNPIYFVDPYGLASESGDDSGGGDGNDGTGDNKSRPSGLPETAEDETVQTADNGRNYLYINGSWTGVSETVTVTAKRCTRGNEGGSESVGSGSSSSNSSGEYSTGNQSKAKPEESEMVTRNGVEQFRDWTKGLSKKHEPIKPYSDGHSIFYDANKTNNHGSDGDNFAANLVSAISLTISWSHGLGEQSSVYDNNRISKALMNAHKVNEARNFYYNKFKGKSNLSNTQMTGYGGSFGFIGFLRAGIDPIEQFVGGMRISIYNTDGKTLLFVVTNETSMNSFLYDLGPSWSRDKLKPGGTVLQTYKWTEPVKR